MKKDNKDFFEVLEKKDSNLNSELDRIRRDIEIESSDRKDKIEKLEEEIMDQITRVEEEVSINL